MNNVSMKKSTPMAKRETFERQSGGVHAPQAFSPLYPSSPATSPPPRADTAPWTLPGLPCDKLSY